MSKQDTSIDPNAERFVSKLGEFKIIPPTVTLKSKGKKIVVPPSKPSK